MAYDGSKQHVENPTEVEANTILAIKVGLSGRCN